MTSGRILILGQSSHKFQVVAVINNHSDHNIMNIYIQTLYVSNFFIYIYIGIVQYLIHASMWSWLRWYHGYQLATQAWFITLVIATPAACQLLWTFAACIPLNLPGCSVSWSCGGHPSADSQTRERCGATVAVTWGCWGRFVCLFQYLPGVSQIPSKQEGAHKELTRHIINLRSLQMF